MQDHSKCKGSEQWNSKRLITAAFSISMGLAAIGCNPHPLKGVETEYSAAGSSNVALEVDRKVDIVFVIDNSGSMGEEQGKLAANFGPFIEKLDEAGADYRIAVTTTDVGGWTCSGGLEGRFATTSCLDRPGDFATNVSGQAIDVFDEACAANCSLTTEQLGILPTVLEAGGEAVARPWIESFAGFGNLADGVTALEAFQCLAPQGVSGCGLERPLEAMAQSLRLSADASELEYGFLRAGANLMVVIVTDEADCSFDDDFASQLFSPSGAKLFFEPGSDLPTSANCWNAGVVCEGSPDAYDDCRPVDLGVDGQLTSVEGQSVLHPVARYINELSALAGDREVMVSIIAGVPQGFPEGTAELIYKESADPDVSREYGIDHGCTSGEGDNVQVATPPVRLRDFADAFAGEAPNLFSVCEDDYTPALTQIVDALVAEFGPACFDECAVDSDDATPGVQPDCRIIERSSASDEHYLSECEFDGQQFVLPADADACWIVHNDADGLTETSADDLAPECQVAGQNLQFELIRRVGVPVVGGTEVRAECEVSAFASIDCPAP